MSIPHAAVDLAARRLEGLRGRAALVVGAGEMAAIAARLLHRAEVRELTIANRTPDRAVRLAEETSARIVALGDLHDELPRHDVVVAATAAPEYVIDTSNLNGNLRWRNEPLVALDLGLPRNIDPAVSEHPLVLLYCVDDLEEVAAETRQQFASEVAAAEKIADEAVWEFLAWWRARTAAPTIAALRDQSEAVRARELDRALRKLQHLSERDREVVASLATAITHKLLHTPIAHLREHDSDEVLQLTQALFGLEPPTPSS
jgi:glutamyl-tRNA reductase